MLLGVEILGSDSVLEVLELPSFSRSSMVSTSGGGGGGEGLKRSAKFVEFLKEPHRMPVISTSDSLGSSVEGEFLKRAARLVVPLKLP